MSEHNSSHDNVFITDILNDIIENISSPNISDETSENTDYLVSSAQHINNFAIDTEDTKSIIDSDDNRSFSFGECYICNTPLDFKETEFKMKPFKLPCDCKQYTHAKCMLKWLRTKSKCPTCRYNFSDSENVSEPRVNRHNARPTTIQNNARFFRRVLQWIILILISVLRLYVVYLVLGRLGLTIIAVIFLSYYAKKCYDSRTILPIQVVFRLPL